MNSMMQQKMFKRSSTTDKSKLVLILTEATLRNRGKIKQFVQSIAQIQVKHLTINVEGNII